MDDHIWTTYFSKTGTFKYDDRTLTITCKSQIWNGCPNFVPHMFSHDLKSELKWVIDVDLHNKLLRIQPKNESVNKRFKFELSIDVNSQKIYGPCVYDGTTFQCGLPACHINNIVMRVVYPYEAITFCSCSLEKSEKLTVPRQAIAPAPLRVMLTRAASREEFADVQFIVEDNLIVAHKHILADRSEVFRKMFLWNADDPTETANDPIQVVNISYAGFVTFVNAIYFGTVPLDPEMCLEVAVLAEKYDIQDVKAAVEASAIKLMDSSNVISMLITSDLHKADLVKEAALKFCAGKPMNEISDIEDLAKYPSLMVEVLNYVQERINLNKA